MFPLVDITIQMLIQIRILVWIYVVRVYGSGGGGRWSQRCSDMSYYFKSSDFKDKVHLSSTSLLFWLEVYQSY